MMSIQALREELDMMRFYRSRGWPLDHKLALCHCLERARREILEDVLAGRISPDVTSFAQLHDYVDANEYGWGFDLPLPSTENEAFVAFYNRVQSALCRWIADGGILDEVLRVRGGAV